MGALTGFPHLFPLMDPRLALYAADCVGFDHLFLHLVQNISPTMPRKLDSILNVVTLIIIVGHVHVVVNVVIVDIALPTTARGSRCGCDKDEIEKKTCQAEQS